MARLTALPAIDVVRRYAGVLDFYMWKGLPCVRAWPRYRPARQTPGSKASAALFGEIIQGYNLVAGEALTAYQDAAVGIPRSPRDIYVTSVLGHLHVRAEAPPPPPPEEQMYDAYVCLRDLKPQNTPGGTFTTGAWRTRDLNDEQADTADICALAANEFILAPGTYRATLSCPAYRVSVHQCRLYNVTDAAVLLLGTSGLANSPYGGSHRSHLAGRFTLAAPKTLRIEHRGTWTRATDGFGRPAYFSQELYTIVELWRETEPEP